MDEIWHIPAKEHNEKNGLLNSDDKNEIPFMKTEVDDTCEGGIRIIDEAWCDGEDNRTNEILNVDYIKEETTMKQGAEDTFESKIELTDGSWCFSDTEDDKQNEHLNLTDIKEEIIVKMEEEDDNFEETKSFLRDDSETHREEKQFKCETCGQRFSQKCYLRRHQMLHTTMFRCQICQKTFSRKVHLYKHMLIHTGVKPFQSETCGQRFTEKSVLADHQMVHTGENPFECLTCGKVFVRKSDLKRHIRVHSMTVTNKTNPVNDIVRNLLKTPFSQWKDDDKRVILQNGRPTDNLSICAKKEVKKTGKSYNINFKSVWFDEFLWLCSSTILEKLFCWPCLLFSNKDSVWNKEGFADLLNITRALHKHADSAEHLKCELMLRNFEESRNTIEDAVTENARLFKIQFNENVRLNRLFLHVVIDAVLYLSKQELVFQGNDESIDSINRENFKELLSLLLIQSPLEIRNQYEKIKSVFTGDSTSIQNELIGCISEYINEYVKTEIKESNFFSIQVDDTTDINQTSQCSLIVRFVNSEGRLVERFLGFHDVSADRTSETLYNILHTVLLQFDYEHKLVGQCYDGASVMSGHVNGLQRKFKDEAPQAIFVHCFTHRLNLVLQQSFGKISSCRIFFASVSEISSFFHQSAKRSYALNSTSSRCIPAITETRWSSHSKLLNVIIEDWNKLKEVFEFIVTCEQSDSKSIQLAKGFLNDMNSFEFTFLAVVFNEIFCSTDLLCDILQKRSLDIIYCISQLKETCEILRGKRTDQFFNTLFIKTTELTEFNVKTSDANFDQDQIKTKYRALFFEIIDHILMEMDVRFQDYEKIKFVCLVDTTKFEQYKSCFPCDALQNLQSYYPDIFTKIQRLRNELSLIYADENYRTKTTLDVFKELHENKCIFTEAFKLFSLVLTIPSTCISVERNFSCLKGIKTYSRNAVSQEILLSLANISIQKELLMDIMKKQPFYEDIIDMFASLKDRRIDLIYKKNKNGLMNHEMLHTGERPFECPTCGKCYIRKSDLSKHVRVHTGQYECQVCQKRFSIKDNLDKHMDVHIGE